MCRGKMPAATSVPVLTSDSAGVLFFSVTKQETCQERQVSQGASFMGQAKDTGETIPCRAILFTTSGDRSSLLLVSVKIPHELFLVKLQSGA